MATKQFLTLEGLTTYDGLIKQYIGTEDAKSIKSISVSGNTVSFFKTADGSGTAAYTVNLPDVSGFMDKIANASGGRVLISDENGEAVETEWGIIGDDERGVLTGYIPNPGTVSGFLTWDGNSRVTLSEFDPDDKMNKIGSTEGGKVLISDEYGDASESEIDVDDIMTKIDSAIGDRVLVSDFNGEAVESDYVIGAISQTGIVTGYLQGESGYIIVQGGGLSDIQSSELDIDDIATTTDLADKIDKISNATGGKIATTTASGEVAESGTAVSDLMTKITNATGDKIVVSTSSGEVTESFDTGYIAGINPDCGYYITCYAGNNGSYNELQVVEDVSSEDLINIKAATAGFDDQNTIADYIGTIPQGSSATDVIGYIDEVAGDVGDDMEISLVEAQTPTTGYLKTYELYQGGNAAANLVGKIDIPKDLVVTSGEIVVNPTGQPAGTYLKLTIANQTAPVYINVADLCDVYTAASGAAQVQLAISATNEISATLVAGGVGTTELAANAVTTAKIADDAVTADKVAISAHTEAQTAGAGNGGLAISVTTTDGQVSAVSGSIAANTYDAYGAASTVQSTVIGTAGDAASANTINGAKAYADAATAAIATADIQALFA